MCSGMTRNQVNKSVMLQFQSQVAELRDELSNMSGEIFSVLQNCRDMEQTDTTEAGQTMSRDDRIDKMNPAFRQRFLKELCVVYKALDELLITKVSNADEPIWVSGRGPDKQGMWATDYPLFSRIGRLKKWIGLESVNSSIDMLYIAQAPFRMWSKRYHDHRNNFLWYDSQNNPKLLVFNVTQCYVLAIRV